MGLEAKLLDTKEQKSNNTQISSKQSNSKEQFDLELNNQEEKTKEEPIEEVKVPVTKTVGAKFEKLSADQLVTAEPRTAKMTISTDIHSVPIAEGTNAESVLYRIKRGTTLRVHGDATLLGREIILHTNYPADGRLLNCIAYTIL